MSERGVLAVDRGVFEHPSFARVPFTEREAWLWLISEAAYRPHQRHLFYIPSREARTFEVDRVPEKWSDVPEDVIEDLRVSACITEPTLKSIGLLLRNSEIKHA